MFLSGGGSGSTGMMSIIVIYAVIFGVMYLLFIRPQRKQQKEMKELLSKIEPGDSVLTTSGFYGVILDVMDDTVIVEFGNNKNCRIPMKKEAISAVEKPDMNRSNEE